MPSPPNWLNRKEAAGYITERGISISAKTLANLAANENAGRGPSFTRSRWNRVRYARVDLDTWVERNSTRVE